jgi:hypothetical protein
MITNSVVLLKHITASLVLEFQTVFQMGKWGFLVAKSVNGKTPQYEQFM